MKNKWIYKIAVLFFSRLLITVAVAEMMPYLAILIQDQEDALIPPSLILNHIHYIESD